MTRYEVRPREKGWQLYDRLRSSWCFGTFSLYKEKLVRLAAGWNTKYESTKS